MNIKDILILLLVVITFSSCDLLHDDNQNSDNKLPPITTTGENTLGCLINGELFLPKGGLPGVISGASVNPMISYEEADGTFQIFASNSNLKYDFYIIGEKAVFSIGELDFGTGSYIRNTNLDVCKYHYIDTLSSKLSITNIDMENNIASGTFVGDFSNFCGDTLRITHGRFDIEYTK